MRTAVVCTLAGTIATVALVAGVAAAGSTATNGVIAFGRFNPALEDTQVYVVNPDGSHMRALQGPDATGELPTWFPDGALIATGGASGVPGGGSRFIDPDNGSFRNVDGTDPSLFNPCDSPSPDGSLLLCETFGHDGRANGIHTIRTSNGGDLRQVTSNPGGDDVPEAWSPDGKQILFQRFEANGTYDGVMLVGLDGTGLKVVLPPSVSANCCSFSWSAARNEILFTRHVTPDVHSSIWAMRPDGTGLRQIDVQPANTCGGPNSDPSAQGCPQAAWSPDGKKIAFSRGQNVDLDGELYVVNADGTGLTQITNAPGSQEPSWGTHPLYR